MATDKTDNGTLTVIQLHVVTTEILIMLLHVETEVGMEAQQVILTIVVMQEVMVEAPIVQAHQMIIIMLVHVEMAIW